ncbi:Clp protease N-terminal domain-containing protein [Streptomyces sp. NPDC086080]|uniref:Clp protease N-terminal domain-containing protein n=1 Tax=Streptomyces sp. NPDC086080 TaxID=3365748 RepID=UPI0037D86F9B
MEAIKEPDWTVVGIMGSAKGAAGAADGDVLGTDHLLAGITASKGAARQALADAGATRTAVMALLRDAWERGVTREGDDDADETVASRDLLGEDGDRRTRFTGAAARALTSAMEQAWGEGAKKFGAVHLLRALLEESAGEEDAAEESTGEEKTGKRTREPNRAVVLLTACGVSPRTVLSLLDGDTPPQEGDLDPLLHPTRDVLLGRSHYRHKVLWKRWLLKRIGVNWASRPAWWVSMETHEQARRLGHDTVGTEHILLAVLATHEVALRYPHMKDESAPTPDTRYTGSERLARMGLDHATVHSALTTGRVPLTADARPAEQYLDEAASPGRPPADAPADTPTTDPGTGPLVDLLLKEETRARQLIESLAPTPDH